LRVLRIRPPPGADEGSNPRRAGSKKEWQRQENLTSDSEKDDNAATGRGRATGDGRPYEREGTTVWGFLKQ